MPLFNYKCLKCDLVVEKFQHKPEKINLECKSCGNGEFDRIFGQVYNRTWLNARDNLSQNIMPEVDRISNNIATGKSKDFLDIYGEK